MELKDCLREYARQEPRAAKILQISNEQLKNYQEKGINGNVMLFFKGAASLEGAGYKVDGYSNLPKVNRDTVYVLLSERATIEVYVMMTGISKDSFTRNLRGSRLLSEKAQQLIEAVNAKFVTAETDETETQQPEAGLKIVDEMNFDYNLFFNLILTAAANANSLEKVLNDFLATSSEEYRLTLRDDLNRIGFPLFAASNALHRISQKLGALCSEKALENYHQKLNQ